MSIFDDEVLNQAEPPQTGKKIRTIKASKKAPVVADIRTNQQKNKDFAYDVGEKVGGSRKDQAALRKLFEEKPSLEILNSIEEESAILADKLVLKNKIAPGIDFESEKEKGVDVEIAYIKKMILQRIDSKPANQTLEGRKQFVEALLEAYNSLLALKDWDDLKTLCNTIYRRVDAEVTGLNRAYDYLAYAKKKLHEKVYPHEIDRHGSEEAVLAKRMENILEKELYIEFVKECLDKPLTILGKKFTQFFRSYNSRKNTLKNVQSKNLTWDDLLEKKTKKSPKTKQKVWERQLPDNPARIGGRKTSVQKPEDLVTIFGFRAIEFGDFVNDDKGHEHIKRSSEAYHDLADILGIQDKMVSLHGRLAQAFGARGRGGNALAHYEPVNKVINLTRDRGSLGVSAHEWGHALDHFIFDASYNFTPPTFGYGSHCTLGPSINREVVDVMEKLMETISFGESITYIENSNKSGDSYRLSKNFKETYSLFRGDLLGIMRTQDRIFRSQYFIDSERKTTTFYSEAELEKSKARDLRKYKKRLKEYANALAWYHEQQTGKRVEKVPVPSNRSQYYLDALSLDKGKTGKYWSNPQELFARAFESYIEDKLAENGRKNDYLVSGCRFFDSSSSIAFPRGEERTRINEKMEHLLEVVVKRLLS